MFKEILESFGTEQAAILFFVIMTFIWVYVLDPIMMHPKFKNTKIGKLISDPFNLSSFYDEKE